MIMKADFNLLFVTVVYPMLDKALVRQLTLLLTWDINARHLNLIINGCIIY